MPHNSARRAPQEFEHTFENDPLESSVGAIPSDDETPDTQESLDVPDGLWQVAEEDGAGRRHATAKERQIAADGLTIVDEDGQEVPRTLRP